MSDCVFCKIVAGSIPSTKVYEDESCLAFRDLEPKAPTHILGIMKEQGVTGGYRIITNAGPDAGQTVPHLHFHVLAGVEMGWDPVG